MKIVNAIILFLKNNPQSKWSVVISKFYSIVYHSRVNVQRGNQLLYSNTYMKNCFISVKGKGNVIDISGGANYLENCRIKIVGNNNIIKLGSRNYLSNTTFWIEDNDNSIIMNDRNRVLGSVEFAVLEGTEIKIGSGCLFADNIHFRTSDSHSVIDSKSGLRLNYAKNIIVKDRVWFGRCSTILKGVTVCSDSIIAANAVITKDVESNVVVAGNPSRVVKKNVTWDLNRL